MSYHKWCRFVQVKDEAWWLVLGNTSTSELFALKRVSFSDRLATHMEMPPNLTNLEVLSFSYFWASVWYKYHLHNVSNLYVDFYYLSVFSFVFFFSFFCLYYKQVWTNMILNSSKMINQRLLHRYLGVIRQKGKSYAFCLCFFHRVFMLLSCKFYVNTQVSPPS